MDFEWSGQLTPKGETASRASIHWRRGNDRQPWEHQVSWHLVMNVMPLPFAMIGPMVQMRGKAAAA